MPVRRIPKSYIGVTGTYSSAKNGRGVGFESLLERDFMVLLEFDPAVEGFEEQPVSIPVQTRRGRASSYVPDVLVRYRPVESSRQRKPSLVEVKKSSDLEKNKEKYAPKFAAAARFAAEHGWEFRVVSEIDIRVPRLPNLKFLSEYRHIEPDPATIEWVLDRVGVAGGSTTMDELLDGTSQLEKLTTIPVVWHLVAFGRLGTDLDRPLSGDSILALPRRANR